MTPSITRLHDEPGTVRALGEMTVAVVAGGASVSFMHPLAPQEARAFWKHSLEAAERGERLVLGAYAQGALAGTVTVDLDTPPNQPHRAEIAKLMTHPDFRGRGIATALMAEAEARAMMAGRTILTLDTASEAGAAPFYERQGYVRIGLHPDYALTPGGALCGTIFYYKRLPTAAAGPI
jgi:ribosomal protein S18 acetylase RimI-like enzyme